jgi:predicted Zn-dependent protease with MMP-like domain
MNPNQFEDIVVATLDSLPEQFTRFFQNIEVIIEPRFDKKTRQTYGFAPNEVVYGLYEGVPLPERSSQEMYMPDTITLFQAPLERDFPHEQELREEIRRTVLHELAHHLGISDERLEELGAY